MDDIAQALQDRLGATPTIGVVGLGYVGLPLAAAFARSGATVVGVDLDARRVAAVNGATSFIEDVTGETLRPLVTSGRLTASDDVPMTSEDVPPQPDVRKANATATAPTVPADSCWRRRARLAPLAMYMTPPGVDARRLAGTNFSVHGSPEDESESCCLQGWGATVD